MYPAALIGDFTRPHPGVAITAFEKIAFMLLGQFRDGDVDLVMAPVDPDVLDGVEGVRLLEEELGVIAPVDDHARLTTSARFARSSGPARVDESNPGALASERRKQERAASSKMLVLRTSTNCTGACLL